MKLGYPSNPLVFYSILFLLIIFCPGKLTAIDQISEDLSSVEVDLEMEQEIKKEYLKLVERQQKKRSRLDTIIGAENLKKVEILRSAYDDKVEKEKEIAILTVENCAPSVKETFAKAMFGANDLHRDRVGFEDCISAIIKPMLMADTNLLTIVQDISQEYHLRISEVRFGILKARERFEYDREKIKAKYRNGGEVENYPRFVRTKSKIFKKDIYVDAWILIINSK